MQATTACGSLAQLSTGGLTPQRSQTTTLVPKKTPVFWELSYLDTFFLSLKKTHKVLLSFLAASESQMRVDFEIHDPEVLYGRLLSEALACSATVATGIHGQLAGGPAASVSTEGSSAQHSSGFCRLIAALVLAVEAHLAMPRRTRHAGHFSTELFKMRSGSI